MPVLPSILSVVELTKDFSGVRALDRVNMDVLKGHVHGLIGPNGAGKSTFFNVVTGILPVGTGQINFDSSNITALPGREIAKLGVSRTFQAGLIVPTMTCLENVMTGCHSRKRTDIAGTFFRLPFNRSKQETGMRKTGLEMLDLVGLSDAADRWAGELVWVERQLLQIARALAAQPKLLLLDEPTAGMGPEESAGVGAIIRQVRDMGVTVVIVSHDVNLVMELSDRVTALNFGRNLFEGRPDEVRRHPKVVEAYLGEE